MPNKPSAQAFSWADMKQQVHFRWRQASIHSFRNPQTLCRVEDFTDIDLLLSAVRAGKARDQEQQAAMSEIESSAATMNFAALVQKCREMALPPDILKGFTASQIQQLLIRQRGLMAASRAYSVQPLPIPVHLFAATEGNPVDPVCTRRPLTPIQKSPSRPLAA
jgi:hypothetical protein